MNLKDFLYITENTSKIIDVKNAPDWVKAKLKEYGIRRGLKVNIGSKGEIPPNWHDANMRTLYFFKDGRIEKIAAPSYDTVASSSDAEKASYKGFKFSFENPDQMILLINSTPKSAELFVHPQAVAKMLDEVPEDISKNEKIVLVATRSLKSSYAGEKDFRFNEARRVTGITKEEWNEAKQSLISKGFLSKTGRITNRGRNAAGDKQLHQIK